MHLTSIDEAFVCSLTFIDLRLVFVSPNNEAFVLGLVMFICS